MIVDCLYYDYVELTLVSYVYITLGLADGVHLLVTVIYCITNGFLYLSQSFMFSLCVLYSVSFLSKVIRSLMACLPNDDKYTISNLPDRVSDFK